MHTSYFILTLFFIRGPVWNNDAAAIGVHHLDEGDFPKIPKSERSSEAVHAQDYQGSIIHRKFVCIMNNTIQIQIQYIILLYYQGSWGSNLYDKYYRGLSNLVFLYRIGSSLTAESNSVF